MVWAHWYDLPVCRIDFGVQNVHVLQISVLTKRIVVISFWHTVRTMAVLEPRAALTFNSRADIEEQYAEMVLEGALAMWFLPANIG